MINQLKTVVLLGALTGVMLLIGGLIGGQQGLTIALVFALLMNGAAYWFSHKIVLMMYRAQPISKQQAPKIHKIVEEVAKAAGIPKPQVYLIPTHAMNAFATGRNPKNAVVAVTQGILKLLTEKELKGVLAHEIGHVKNRDILITTIASTIAAVISYVAMMARWAAIFGGGGRDNQGKGNILQLLVLAILAPLIAMILQMAISRSREYLADERGAKITKDPEALASALLKLEESARHIPLKFGNSATSSLFIINPFKGAEIFTLFSTHPSTQERVKRLRAMNA